MFCGWGLGLFGQLSTFSAALVSVGAWLALTVFATFWLSRYRCGPFEWLLRAWSYRSWPALRLPPAAAGEQADAPRPDAPARVGS
ncbi:MULTISPECIES: DUF418 domain-containing protein [Micromonospora]|uniref:DUF418 domain-containing protein n=1 Tax=Micromonospora TaxID=1873 RepID=UPI000B8059E5|nr:DUF418 domain-containing protein [Micromonospora yangpuensis]